MRILRKLSALIDGLNDRIGVAIRWLALIMVFIGAVSAVARYFARSQQWQLNLTPTTEAQWYLFSIIFLMGAAYGLNHDVHVRVDVMYERMKPKTQAWIDLAGTVLFLLPFSIMMLWVSYRPVMASWRIRESSPDPGGLARWPIKMLILVSFALLVLQGISQLVKQIDVIRGTTPALNHHEGEPEAHV
jgi:TRAP-type mannitol/chloroaromatic compound transport system permease small subunit